MATKRKAVLRAAGIMTLMLAFVLCGGKAEAKEPGGMEVPAMVEEVAGKYGSEYNIQPEFLEAMAFCESSYSRKAVGGSCIGLMQINPKWHADRMARLGIEEKELFDCEKNMQLAADYLSELFGEYEDAGMVLMVYNGDADAQLYMEGKAQLSDYAEKVLELSEALERRHGK